MVFVWYDYCFASKDLTGMQLQRVLGTLSTATHNWLRELQCDVQNNSQSNARRRKRTAIDIFLYQVYVTRCSSRYLRVLQAETTGTIGFPSLLSHLASSQLIHHIHVLPAFTTGPSPRLRRDYTGLQAQLSCDIHLLNLRTLESTSHLTRTALILHRHGIDCGFPTYGATCQCSNGRVRLVSIG